MCGDITFCVLHVLQRTAGSSSDGTADSDDSGDHEKTDSSHSEANQRNNTRMTRASLRLSQSSQGINIMSVSALSLKLRLRAVARNHKG